MKTEDHPRSVGYLIAAGFLSLAISAWGLMAFAWGYNPERDRYNVALLLFCLTPTVSFLVFLLAASLTRLGEYALWLMVLLIWGSYAFIQMQDPHAAPKQIQDWLEVLSPPVFVPSFIPSILVAFFVQLGTRHFRYSFDRFLLRLIGMRREHAG